MKFKTDEYGALIRYSTDENVPEDGEYYWFQIGWAEESGTVHGRWLLKAGALGPSTASLGRGLDWLKLATSADPHTKVVAAA